MEKAEVPVSTRSRVAANTSNAARMRAQLLEVVRDIHKHLDLSGSLGSYGALLAAYADCGTSVDVCKVLAQMQAAGCWPDLANYEVVVRVYAREGALPEALAAIHQAKGQLAGRLRVERWLRGALWIGGGMLFIKWAGMAAASILGPEARSVVWIGAGVLTMTLAARVIAGFWVHPDALRTRQSGNATLTTTITASAITPNHAGDSLLLLSAHDIDDYLQTVAANSLLQHWDTAMAHQVCGALEASDSVQRWLTDGATQHGTPIWLQRLCDGLLPQRSADAWEVSRMAGNKAGQPLLSPDTLLALLDALRVAGDVHRAQEAAKLAALLDVPVPDATRSWIDQQSKHSSLTTALLQAQAKLPTKRQKLRQIKKSHGDKH
ncbi:hypothetical protein THASP1DRAFT_29421 [Thamnocephalis sphaerospora]|uniref:Pentacotripeptide-repeat region of PRORP domain-containing protein n=1 Tax=Thamnocephalis sphaerospora TaxID=78915 RepID=A0A4P9XL59_9FUNG|nr:hypothetical protein THASP1DRAFT_31667 [Thamnocephalis sphaerospora]RKP08775.1 hypothetical protein THASP1DRAFT_29421 [Thamnocephalis sphaerospora]|eukprot:RKP06522.1 hypothetical protein THASP1DRAFT_31667 [Thamnocephalis sphaerospora]